METKILDITLAKFSEGRAVGDQQYNLRLVMSRYVPLRYTPKGGGEKIHLELSKLGVTESKEIAYRQISTFCSFLASSEEARCLRKGDIISIEVDGIIQSRPKNAKAEDHDFLQVTGTLILTTEQLLRGYLSSATSPAPTSTSSDSAPASTSSAIDLEDIL